MRKHSEGRVVALALAALALLLPRAAAANSFDGLGVYVAAMLVGLPALGLLVAGVVTSVVGLRRGRDARAWRGWAGVALFLSPLLILAFPLAAAALEGDVSPEGTLWVLALDLPSLLLGVASTLLALRLRRRFAPNAPGSAPAA